MMITLGEIFQSIMAGFALLSNMTFVIIVALACFGKVTWFYDLVKIPYNQNPSKRSLFDSILRVTTLFLGIICEAFAGRFTKYGLFGSIFAFVELLVFISILGQLIILFKETKELSNKRKDLEKRMQEDIEKSRQQIVNELERHAVAVQIDCDPEEFFRLMSDPEEFKKWLKDHKLQLTEEDRMQMTPEEEEAMIAMGFLPTREEVAEAREKAALEEKEPSEEEGKKK